MKNKMKLLENFLKKKDEVLQWIYRGADIEKNMKKLFNELPDHFHPWPELIVDIKYNEKNVFILTAPEWKSILKETIWISIGIERKGLLKRPSFIVKSNCRGDFPLVIKIAVAAFEKFILEESLFLMNKISNNFDIAKKECALKEFGLQKSPLI